MRSPLIAHSISRAPLVSFQSFSILWQSFISVVVLLSTFPGHLTSATCPQLCPFSLLLFRPLFAYLLLHLYSSSLLAAYSTPTKEQYKFAFQSYCIQEIIIELPCLLKIWSGQHEMALFLHISWLHALQYTLLFFFLMRILTFMLLILLYCVLFTKSTNMCRPIFSSKSGRSTLPWSIKSYKGLKRSWSPLDRLRSPLNCFPRTSAKIHYIFTLRDTVSHTITHDDGLDGYRLENLNSVQNDFGIGLSSNWFRFFFFFLQPWTPTQIANNFSMSEVTVFFKIILEYCW